MAIMALKKVGKQTVEFTNPPVITGYASIVGKKEGPRESGGFWPGIKGLSHGKERPKIKRSLLPSRKEQTAFGVLQI